MFITELQRRELVPATSIALEPKPPLYWALASRGIINNATSGKNAFIQFREFFAQWFPDFISVLSITRPLGIVSWGKLPFWDTHFILFQYGKEGSLKREEPAFLASFPLDVSYRKTSRETLAGRCLYEAGEINGWQLTPPNAVCPTLSQVSQLPPALKSPGSSMVQLRWEANTQQCTQVHSTT